MSRHCTSCSTKNTLNTTARHQTNTVEHDRINNSNINRPISIRNTLKRILKKKFSFYLYKLTRIDDFVQL